jgi:acyl-coenzyme A synthetase/AMP-(fatty) acid ligase
MVPNFDTVLKEGCTVSSSGTTGPSKDIYRDPDNLKACNDVAIEVQEITKDSRIYTCTRMTHPGGLLLQSLPAYTLGCEIHITKFNVYKFLNEFANYTHTFLPPGMCEALINTKNFAACDLSGKIVAMGSDSIPWHHIYQFVNKGAIVITNWGMSEIGPCVINTVFTNSVMVSDYKSRSIPQATIMGDKTHCSVRIANDQLYVKGDISIYKDKWFATGDYVAVNNKGEYYYYGRDKTKTKVINDKNEREHVSS